MKTSSYLIAYDIAHPRRLARVARVLERHAIRCQKSVFAFDGSRRALVAVFNELRQIIDPRKDCVQAWNLSRRAAGRAFACGPIVQIRPTAAVIWRGRHQMIGGEEA